MEASAESSTTATAQPEVSAAAPKETLDQLPTGQTKQQPLRNEQQKQGGAPAKTWEKKWSPPVEFSPGRQYHPCDDRGKAPQRQEAAQQEDDVNGGQRIIQTPDYVPQAGVTISDAPYPGEAQLYTPTAGEADNIDPDAMWSRARRTLSPTGSPRGGFPMRGGRGYHMGARNHGPPYNSRYDAMFGEEKISGSANLPLDLRMGLIADNVMLQTKAILRQGSEIEELQQLRVLVQTLHGKVDKLNDVVERQSEIIDRLREKMEQNQIGNSKAQTVGNSFTKKQQMEELKQHAKDASIEALKTGNALRKSKLCFNWTRAICYRGSTCIFSHWGPPRFSDFDHLRDDKKPGAKRPLDANRCLQRSEGKLSDFPEVHKKLLKGACKYHVLGRCGNGKHCFFEHI